MHRLGFLLFLQVFSSSTAISIESVTPSRAQRSETVTVTIIGNNTEFVQGVTEAKFGEGISVGGANDGDFGPVTVTSRTRATARIVIADDAELDEHSVTIRTRQDRVSLRDAFTVIAPPVRIAALPDRGRQQETLTVTITGNNTHFQNGVTEAWFGDDISVGGEDSGRFGPLVVNSPTRATARIRIEGDADPSERKIVVRTRQEWVALRDGFTVLPAPPRFTLSPDAGRQDQTMTVTITGDNTRFVPGRTEVRFGSGISVGNGKAGQYGSVTVNSPTRLTARIEIDGDADTDDRTISIRTNADKLSMKDGFTVLPSRTPISVAPNTGTRGQTLTVTITSPDAHFERNETEASFGPGIEVGDESGYGPVTVLSRTRATAELSIRDAAKLGSRTVRIRTGKERFVLKNGFTVTASPISFAVDPDEGRSGQTFTVTIRGQNTHFVQGQTEARFGQGISVGGRDPGEYGPLAVQSATLATARLTIAAGSVNGSRTVTVKTGAERVSLVDGFDVMPPVTAPPTITTSVNPPPNAAGWNNANVTVTFTCASAAGIASCTAPVAVTTEGASQVITGTAVDNAGNTATASVVVKMDKTAPSIQAARSPQANAQGWNNADVTVTFAGTDTLSGLASCSPAVTLNTEGANLSASGTCTDIADNVTPPSTLSGIKIDKTAPTVTFDPAAPAANAAGWNNTDVTIAFAAADALSGVASTSTMSPLSFTTEGTSLNRAVTVADVAGNSAIFTSPSLKIDKTPPALAITAPSNGAVVSVATVTVTGTTADTLSGLESATCNGLPIDPLQSPFLCEVVLNSGSNVVTAFANDVAGNSAGSAVTVSFANGSITNLTAQPNSVLVGLGTAVTLTARVADLNVVAGSVVVQRVDAAGNATGTLGTMRDDGSGGDAQAGDGTFTAVPTILENNPGLVRLRVSADVQGGGSPVQSSVLELSVVGVSTSIQILSPATGNYVSLSPIQVQGQIGDPSLSVTVNGINAVKTGNTFSASVPLIEGTNTITAVSTAANGSTGSNSILIILDTTPPRITITSPVDGGHTTSPSIDVTGIVNDIVFGTVNPQQATVTVNGAQAVVSNRTFSSSNVQLVVGSNTLRAEGRDRVGNVYVQVINVIRDAVPAGAATIAALAGSNQTGAIGTQLPVPLAVQLTNAQNQPAANMPVIFRVTESDGLVNGLPAIAVNTDAQGRAQVNYALGTRAGAGSNRVEAFATGFMGKAEFIASALNGSPVRIHIDSGLNQTGPVGQALPFPFVAVVTDSGSNRIGNVPVTFRVIAGAGSINGSTTFSTTSDSDGRVAATLALGPQEGISNNVVEVNFTGNTNPPAIFNASALMPGRADQTTISGVVLDNGNRPIPNVTIRMFRIGQGANNVLPVQIGTPVVTDAQGTFRVVNAPVGIMKLMADGSTALPNGDWPTLEYDLLTVAGRDNTVGMPIYLPRLDQANRLCVSPTTGGTLTLAQVPGFALAVAPGSATFPGGSRTGCISVTPVNPDKVPMSPGFGQQPRFVVTIQPAGTMFNPPARIQMPNVDGLSPRSKTEMYSYDHDLAAFVAIGAGTVSEDGSLITSDPGVGVIKAGWHCGGNPNPTGSAGTCPECQTCTNGSCVPSAGSCNDNNACTENDRCENGSCTGTPFEPPESRVTDQFDVSFPPSLLDKINSVFNYIPGLQGSRFDTVRVGGSTRTSDCCDPSTGIQRGGLTEKAGRFQLEINLQEGIRLWGTPRYDYTVGFGGIAELQITFELSLTTLRGRFQFNAEVGSRDRQCEPRENCIFGEVNAVQQVDLLRGTAEVKACLAIFGDQSGCAGARVVLIPGRVTFGWGVTYNKPSCGAGLGGTAYLGAVVARGEFAVTIAGSEYRAVRQITIFQGVSGL